jgi:hypothetical protein
VFSSIINNLLTEYLPSTRLLSGETIIFQNEILDIFKDMINASTSPLNED